MVASGGAYANARARLVIADTADVDLLIKWTQGSTNEQYLSMGFRTGTTWGGDGEQALPADGYVLEIPGNATGIVLYEYVATTRTSISSSSKGSVSAAAQWMRIQATGTTIRWRWWLDGSGEPGVWDQSLTDATFTTGRCTLSFFNGGGGGSEQVNFDEYTLTTAGGPAAATVQHRRFRPYLLGR